MVMRSAAAKKPAGRGALAMTAAAIAVGCILVLGALVAHTRSLTATHREVAGLFDETAHPLVRRAGGATLDQSEAAQRAAAVSAAEAAGDVGGALCDAESANPLPNTELWGDVVVPGAGPDNAPAHTATSAAGCCAACEALLGCNVWVWCADEARCGQQCWLKHVGDPAAPAKPHAEGKGVPWVSGALRKDGDVAAGSLPAPNASLAVVALATAHGTIRLRLRPEWHQESVDFVRSVAEQGLCSPACAFYRVEPGFLLQGSLRARLPAPAATKPAPAAMVKGQVGWAGGGAGPDFFIYLGDQPATHWARGPADPAGHTVWAELADAASLAVAEAIVKLPPAPTKPGEMHMLAEHVKLECTAG